MVRVRTDSRPLERWIFERSTGKVEEIQKQVYNVRSTPEGTDGINCDVRGGV